jgi:hypothetical protein
LEDVTLALHLRNDLLQHILLVEAKAAREIGNSGPKKRVSESKE